MENSVLNNNEEDADVEVRCHSRVSAGRTPSERSLHTCTLQTIEGCRVVYLYGGRSKNGTALDDLHVLDLEAHRPEALRELEDFLAMAESRIETSGTVKEQQLRSGDDESHTARDGGQNATTSSSTVV